jgi:hypothetical protein
VFNLIEFWSLWQIKINFKGQNIENNFVEKNILKGKNIEMKKVDCWCWQSDLLSSVIKTLFGEVNSFSYKTMFVDFNSALKAISID